MLTARRTKSPEIACPSPFNHLVEELFLQSFSGLQHCSCIGVFGLKVSEYAPVTSAVRAQPVERVYARVNSLKAAAQYLFFCWRIGWGSNCKCSAAEPHDDQLLGLTKME
jgi:hypothetical protein